MQIRLSYKGWKEENNKVAGMPYVLFAFFVLFIAMEIE